jgi:hypothetical protein
MSIGRLGSLQDAYIPRKARVSVSGYEKFACTKGAQVPRRDFCEFDNDAKTESCELTRQLSRAKKQGGVDAHGVTADGSEVV